MNITRTATVAILAAMFVTGLAMPYTDPAGPDLPGKVPATATKVFPGPAESAATWQIDTASDGPATGAAVGTITVPEDHPGADALIDAALDGTGPAVIITPGFLAPGETTTLTGCADDAPAIGDAPCTWNAHTQGNGTGASFLFDGATFYYEDGTTVPADH